MAAGKFNMQANDGAVIGLIVPDGLTSGERQISLGVNLKWNCCLSLTAR